MGSESSPCEDSTPELSASSAAEEPPAAAPAAGGSSAARPSGGGSAAFGAARLACGPAARLHGAAAMAASTSGEAAVSATTSRDSARGQSSGNSASAAAAADAGVWYPGAKEGRARSLRGSGPCVGTARPGRPAWLWESRASARRSLASSLRPPRRTLLPMQERTQVDVVGEEVAVQAHRGFATI